MQHTCNVNKYILNLRVTTAITSSCAQALIKKVTNIAVVLETRWLMIVAAYTCLSRKVYTGLFHFRENSSHDVEFHQSS